MSAFLNKDAIAAREDERKRAGAIKARTRPPEAPVLGIAGPRGGTPTGDNIPAGIGGPDLGSLTAAGTMAAAKQRKRVGKYAMLIEGQPGGQGINPNAVLNRKSLLGY